MAKFKTRARTVDMLGRQQIAGVSTAISELFKNAHDAYADHVEVDYYRSDGLFILRDDGIGMTREDFEGRWLTLGTESKLKDSRGLISSPRDPDKPLRPILGEKGIGRLSIASIGPQVLVLTRAKREGKYHDLVASFINWRLFEIPGIDLDQVIIPLESFTDGTVPDKTGVDSLVSQVKENVVYLEKEGKIQQEEAEIILTELEGFQVNPAELYTIMGSPTLLGDNEGTHFFISPAYDTLQDSIEGEKWRVTGGMSMAPPLIKTLIGFTNTMAVDDRGVKIEASFRDHRTDDNSEELISEDQFFTPEEFQMADHHFQGEFDEYGQFHGKVTVYGEDPVEHVISWTKAKGHKTKCGLFKINVAYVQGRASESMIPLEEWALITRKLDRIGGLYIYKDGIRILPYGDTDYDWLDIEKNRTKSAGYYYFSYRRIFGYINISNETNRNLIEKAGREGFMENKAYREFREILSKFFIQLAADFFRDKGGPQTEVFSAKKEEFKRLNKAKQAREERAKEKKNKLKRDLEVFFKFLEEGRPSKDIEELLENARVRFITACEKVSPDEAISSFLDAESKCRDDLAEIQRRYKVIKTRGFAINRQMTADYEAYQDEYYSLEMTLFEPAQKQLEEMASNILDEKKIEVSRRRRLENAITQITTEAKKNVNQETRQTRKLADKVKENIIELTREIMFSTDKTIREAIIEFEELDTSSWRDEQIVSERERFEEKIDQEILRNKETLMAIQDQLGPIALSKEENGSIITVADMTEAMEDELIYLREKADLDMELTQLGLALGIIHHEFGGTIKTIRQNIKRLKTWADVTEELEPIYDNIRSSFEHLDGYLTLFTPLNRRLYRKEVEITGNAIQQFLEDIFSERIKRHGIKLNPTLSFKRKTIVGFPSTFYPVFVNLIDNAIFWLKDQSESRVILLDADETGFYVSNNGPEIKATDREKIFEYGFTRKPNGRGLGLYISREVLKKVGYTIKVIEPKMNLGVTFFISPEARSEEMEG